MSDKTKDPCPEYVQVCHAIEKFLTAYIGSKGQFCIGHTGLLIDPETLSTSTLIKEVNAALMPVIQKWQKQIMAGRRAKFLPLTETK